MFCVLTTTESRVKIRPVKLVKSVGVVSQRNMVLVKESVNKLLFFLAIIAMVWYVIVVCPGHFAGSW